MTGRAPQSIGTEARQGLKLMDAKIFLELWVKVRSGWADDEARVRSFGYGDEALGREPASCSIATVEQVQPDPGRVHAACGAPLIAKGAKRPVQFPPHPPAFAARADHGYGGEGRDSEYQKGAGGRAGASCPRARRCSRGYYANELLIPVAGA